jgi:small subunit ribosomal protein S6
MRTYEVLFILTPQVAEEEATTLIADFKRVGESTGATLKNEEAWGRRRLAYPINKFNEGHYHLFVYESGGSLSELDRRMRNSDRVLRHMIVRTDEDQKRADKLAKRNPKKERLRTAPGAPATGTTAYPPSPAAATAPASADAAAAGASTDATVAANAPAPAPAAPEAAPPAKDAADDAPQA